MPVDEKIGLSLETMVDLTPESSRALAGSIEKQGYFYRSMRMTREEFAAMYPEIPQPESE